VSVLILIVDDEEDVDLLFRQRFRHDLKAGRFVMEFAQSASAALQCIANVGSASLILIFSDINIPGMSGLELLPQARGCATRRACHHDNRLRRRRNQAKSLGRRR
jgi:CheY-like chemotaxis protein